MGIEPNADCLEATEYTSFLLSPLEHVSTTNHGQDVSMQTRELRQFVEARGWSFVSDYVDEGISGTKDKRPALDRLMSDAFDVVVCWRFDRFARSVSHLLRALETFNALGIAFVSLSENVDTTTPTGKMIFTVLGGVAELERSLIVERVRAGLRNARAKGRSVGPCRLRLRELCSHFGGDLRCIYSVADSRFHEVRSFPGSTDRGRPHRSPGSG
jgi:DNA invertase Pin-like site-specific DNA recombinase